MSNTQLSTKDFFARPNVVAKFQQLLGPDKSAAYITNVLQVVNGNSALANADPLTVFAAAVNAAAMNLSISPALGHAYIVPFKGQAQFQMGYKGLIQLAQRSGQFKSINEAIVYEGQLATSDPLMGFTFDWSAKKSDVVIGYAARFELLNGFEKTIYMSRADVLKHAGKFSQTFKKGFGIWKDHEEAMAIKTVVKQLLKWAPLSIDMQRAVVSDQAVVVDADTLEVSYVDNEIEAVEVVDKVAERIAKVEEAK